LADADLIIWDEAPMNDRRCFEALDRTLKDILDSPDTLFGGKTIVLGGDFRQTLPIKKGASKMEIIASTIAHSYLWPSFQIITLTQNMRLLQSDMNENERALADTFASWLLDLGDGMIGNPAAEDNDDSSWVQVPTHYCIEDDEDGLQKLIEFIYDEPIICWQTDLRTSKFR
jgi:hypothetical protein